MQLLETSQWLCIPICRVGASLSLMEISKELNCWLWWRLDDGCEDDVTRVGGLCGQDVSRHKHSHRQGASFQEERTLLPARIPK